MEGKAHPYIPSITGDYASKDLILARAREFFLTVIQTVKPKPLFALRDDVLPKYEAAFDFEKSQGCSELELRKLSCQALADMVLRDELEGLESLSEFQVACADFRRLYDASAALIAWSKTVSFR